MKIKEVIVFLLGFLGLAGGYLGKRNRLKRVLVGVSISIMALVFFGDNFIKDSGMKNGYSVISASEEMDGSRLDRDSREGIDGESETKDSIENA